MSDEYEKAFLEAAGPDDAELNVDLTPPAEEPLADDQAPEVLAQDETPEPSKETPPSPPAGTPEASAAEAAKPDSEESLKSRYEGTKARYLAEERKRKELEREVAELRSKMAERESASAIKVDLDDVDKEQIEEFRKAHPEIAKATVDGPRASAWQKLLIDRGVDDMLVQYEAVASVAEQVEQRNRDELARRDHEAHLAAISTEHPDWESLIYNPAPKNENDGFHPAFVGWVNALPHELAVRVANVVRSGSAQEINLVLKAYKEARSGAPPSKDNKAPTPPASASKPQMKAALAVHNRGSASPKQRAGSEDFEGAWREAVGG